MLVISQESDFNKPIQFGLSEYGDVIVLNETALKDSPMRKECDCYQGTHENNTLYGSCCWVKPAPGGFPACSNGCI